MKPLRICFLWHQHQPYYRLENRFILPWVRFHGVKDYLDLPLLLDEFPQMRQTFNIVPSLLLQLIEYTNEGVYDRIQELTKKHPSELSEEEKNEIKKQFFVCNFNNLIFPYERYLDLYKKAKSNEELSEQDWLDLQVWYNLAWIGQLTRQKPQFRRYFTKGRNFTQKEKEYLIEEQLKLLEEIIPTLKRLCNLGQIELSVSPFYHPILPLLCDSGVAKVGLPELKIPEPPFAYPEDAKLQILEGKKFFKSAFGFEPIGLWPSEGSLSTEVLNIILEQDFQWTATDAKLLFKTIGEGNQILQYFPFVYEKDGRKLVLFFRDSLLSDAIGFTYQNWNSDDAVLDFVNILKLIRSRIVDAFGEDSLGLACVPIILDGENCWEYYKDNGVPFLRRLYETILNEPTIETYTFGDIVASIPKEYKYFLKAIYPGSWINANFYTWIGQPAKQTAWSFLSKARKEVENHKSNKELYEKAMKLILIAEGSDWFWWYGDDNIAPNKDDFDKLFRWYLRKVYETLGETAPEELDNPIGNIPYISLLNMPTKQITENNRRNLNIDLGWGMFYAKSAIGTMQANKAFISEIYFGNTKKMFLIGLKFLRKLELSDKVWIYINSPKELEIELGANEITFKTEGTVAINNFYFSFDEDIVVGVDLQSMFGAKENFTGSLLEFTVKTENELGEMRYPFDGTFTYFVV
ncbi:MAG: glycoside hydrolase family 57 protein [Ignavibacteria bacterium]|nr:glycoside hydrolase family 57 protein [Ignavibacteria bacterium]